MSCQAATTWRRVSASDPEVSIRRVATGSTRSRRWRCAAIRRSASSAAEPAIAQPAPLDRRVAGDQPDLVAQLGEPALDELDRLDDDRRRTRRVGGLDPRPGSAAGRRDGRSPRDRAGPPDRRTRSGRARARSSVPSGARTLGPERDRRRPADRRRPRVDDLAGHGVGVDDDRPALGEPARRRSTCRSRSAR